MLPVIYSMTPLSGECSLAPCEQGGFDSSVKMTENDPTSVTVTADQAWNRITTGSSSGEAHQGGTSGGNSADSPPPPIVWTNRLGVPGSDAPTWCRGWQFAGVTQQVCLLPEAQATTPSSSPSPSASSSAPTIDVAAWAVYAASTLRLPYGTPVIGPDPHHNDWDMLAVGLPVWFWTNDQASVDATVTMNGIPIQLTADRTRTTFDLGDGTTLVCDTTTPRPADADPMQSSPTCGHTYQRVGTYTVEATTWWSVRWSALGQSGRLSVPVTATAPLQIGELKSVIVKRQP